MKRFALIILIALISNIISEDCESKQSASSYKDCKDLTLTGDDKYCCFYKYTYKLKDSSKEEEFKGCGGITQSEYDDIKKYIKDTEDEVKKAGGEMKLDKIDCKLNFLQYYLSSLLLLILL